MKVQLRQWEKEGWNWRKQLSLGRAIVLSLISPLRCKNASQTQSFVDTQLIKLDPCAGYAAMRDNSPYIKEDLCSLPNLQFAHLSLTE